MHTLPDPLTLSEAEWFSSDWPLADLWAQYHDDRFDDMRREHAFFRYWIGWLKTSANAPVSRNTLEEILAHPAWPSPAGEIVVQLMIYGRVEPQDAAWIRTRLPVKTWAHDQTLAFLLLAEPLTDWAETLRKQLALRADWAAHRLFHSLPSNALAEAAQIIQESSRPKKTRRWLLAELDRCAGKP